jgi:small basic protein
VDWVKNVSLCTEDLLTIKFLACLEFHFSQIRALLKGNMNKHQLAAKSVSSLLFNVPCLHMNFWLCYSPNSGLCDFFLFQKFKTVLEQRKFNNTTMICGKLQDSCGQVQTMHIKKCFRK